MKQMELLFLDEQFRLMSAPVDDYNSLQWVRRYHKPGQFTLHLSPRLYDVAMSATYIYNNATDETAIITGRKYSTGGEEAIELSGAPLEHMLTWRCVEKPEAVSGNLESEIRRIVQKYAMTGDRAIPRLSLGPAVGLTAQIDDQISAKDLATWLYSVLEPHGMSFRLRYDYDKDSIIFTIWQGVDRTQSQGANQPAVFSADFENITDVTYERDERDYRNFAFVVYEYTPDGADDSVRLTETIDRRNGEQLREVYLTPRGIAKKDDSGNPMSTAQIRAAMRQAGIDELNKRKRVVKADGELHDTPGLAYRVGYDLGDLCDFSVPRRNLAFSSRITQITEVYESGILTVAPVFGDDYLTIREMIDRGR